MCDAPQNRQRGSALVVMLALVLAAMAFIILKALNSSTASGRAQADAAVLAQAKQALIGFAATYRDNAPSHVNEVFGFLPCPDTNNDGVAEASCGAVADVSVVGRLPWKTLGLPPLRDSAGECLWYAVSGRAKNSPKTSALNWDTTGQLQINDADGAVLVSAGNHGTPWAVVFAPGAVLAGQDRTLAGPATECGGNLTATNYLENGGTFYAGVAPAAGADTTLTLSTHNSIFNQTNNDQGQWITSSEIFDRVKNRSDFKTDIDAMLDDMQVCMDYLSVAALPVASAGNKGLDNAVAACLAAGPKKLNVQTNWKDNLLYTKPVLATTVNGVTGCNAVLLFGGERTTRTTAPLTAQTRITAAEKGNAVTFGDRNMYLETANDVQFPNGPFTGAANFSPTNSKADLVRCIKGLPAGASQTSFAHDFASFTVAGAGVTATSPTVSIANAGGASGGCFWLPNTVALAGKTVRAYYDYQFANADTFALTGSGTDRGNGITLDFVDGSIGSPTALCGRATDMGAFISTASPSPGDMWALESFTIETDVHNDAANNDSTENHTAIMAYGNLAHGSTVGSNGYLTTACNGSAAGCRFAPANSHAANLFEESPLLSHNQRVEIHSGCNSTCSSCNPASHVAPNTYVKISTWVDCTDCKDVTGDNGQTPTVNRCIILDPALNAPYIALTGGFRSGAATQGVTLSNFILRSE